MNDKRGNKGQVTIFVIIAIIIVAVVVLFFVFRGTSQKVEEIPLSLQPPYSAFLFCLEDELLNGIRLLETQGGYMELPDFEPGSSYMPFSSHFNFLSVPIPYWYYVSGNNIQKEQVPSINRMQNELENFIEARASGCELDFYYEQGFQIAQGAPKSRVLIRDDEIQVDLDMDLEISGNEESAVIESHNVIVDSNLKKLYDSAKAVYETEQNNLFLENYGVDTLRAYAPVDGIEITCSPKIWNADEVFNDLEEAVEVNTLAIKSNGDNEDYFVADLPLQTDVNVRFLNSKTWTKSFEVAPNEGNLLISRPVGNQPGLGILGFCYVPYHFVYSLKYPVLVQVEKDGEIFQFPIAVVIQGNKPREQVSSISVEGEIPDFCEYKNTLVEVSTYDFTGGRVEAEISYECSNTVCGIGKTENGKLTAEFPQCVNGRVVARADGYKESEYPLSTNEENSVDVYLDRIYPLEVKLKIDGRELNKNAVITFYSNGSGRTTTIVYPEQDIIELTQGDYEVQVYVYDNTNLTLGSSIQEQCVEVPKGGIGGILGLTEEECFDIEIPEQIISNALSGGGKQEYFLLPSTLERSSVIEIGVDSLPKPASLEQLQTNYILFDNKGVDLNFI